MADIADLFDEVRADLISIGRELSNEELDREVPATPGWSIRDVLTHLAADVACAKSGDFPGEFFAAFGEPEVLGSLNAWTAKQVEDRKGQPLDEVLDEWEQDSKTVASMMRGDEPFPEGVPMFGERILLTDVTVHQLDIHGTLGLKRVRDSVQVKIGAGGYIATMGFRLAAVGIPPLQFSSGDRSWLTHEGEPTTTVETSRFEFFRSLSGRRSPEQVIAYEWEGDPKPYLNYFYPYGLRTEALVE